ncbi:MAG: BspA family leucine-rich repeat surface protein [Bacteroidales bacterium]|nr:BspA family leucine-rich repeat surface protein [Bacteroidales bacterium]
MITTTFATGSNKLTDYPLYIEGKNSTIDPNKDGFTYQEKSFVVKYQNSDLTLRPAYQNITKVVFDDSFADFEPTTLGKWFANLPAKLNTVEGLDKNVNFDNVTSIASLFYQFGGYSSGDFDESIIYTILSQIPMDNVKYMSGLFSSSSVTNIDFSKIPNFNTSFNTSNVIDMSEMFYSCQHLKTVNLANLKTNSVTTMEEMFRYCIELESVDISGFNMSNVEDMDAMFMQCYELTTITGFEGEDFNTSKVTTMTRLFNYCEKLELPESATKSLEVGNVTDMFCMFEGCKSIRKIDLSNTDADGTHLDKIASLCEGCSNLESINLKGISFSGISHSVSGNEFDGCSKLTEIDLSGFSAVSGYMLFTNCSSLKKVILPEGGLKLGNNLWSMFEGCSSLEYVDFSKFEVIEDGSIDLSYFCYNSSSLINVDLSFLQGKTILSMLRSFNGCSNLASILVSDDFFISSEADEANVTDREYPHPVIGKLKDMPIFDGCVEIIGDKGTRYDENNLKKDYAIIDGGASNPGYLTTGNYKIFYELDGGNLPEGKTNPKEFAKNDEVTLVNPERDGYVFTGWSGTSASRLTEKSLNVSFKNSEGNRIYTANWQPRVVAEVDGNISYPKNAALYCDGKETTITLPFAIKSGVVNGFILSFTDDKLPKMEGQITNNDKNIIINVPESLTSGVYNGTLVFTSAIDAESVEIPITLTVNNVHNAAVQLYTDMLIADNHSGVYSAYQWYRDGEPIQGANEQYYVDKFDYNKSYSVKLSGNGEDIMSCPVRWLSTAKVLNPSVKVYPNPAKENELFTLEILDFDETQNYDIVIFTANGTLVKKISNVEKQTSVSLPTGIYSGSLISGDDKKGFKIIVK